MESTQERTMYIITGTDTNGKRFKIETKTPQHYNIYKGSLWHKCTITNRKLLIKRYY